MAGVKVVYTHECRGCDWQPDPSARASVETQIERHVKKCGATFITRGVPEVKEDG